MKVLCLLDRIRPDDRWLWKYLPDNTDQVDFLYAQGFSDRYKKWGKLVSYYPAYWQLGAAAIRKTRRSNYDVVVAWEGKNGFPYALLRSLLNQKTPPLVILTFIYRGMIRHFNSLARFGMRSVDHISVTTEWERKEYQKEFGLSPDSISVIPFPWYDPQWIKDLPTNGNSEKFILASGRSYRDYSTLAEAVRGLDTKVRLIARQFNLEGVELPDNVLTTDLLPIKEYQILLHQAEFVVLPLQPIPHSAGDSHLVQSMSASKAIIASRAPSPETYIKEGETGLLVEPENPAALRSAIEFLLNNPAEAVKMGQNGRKRFEENYTFEKFAGQVERLLIEVANG